MVSSRAASTGAICPPTALCTLVSLSFRSLRRRPSVSLNCWLLLPARASSHFSSSSSSSRAPRSLRAWASKRYGRRAAGTERASASRSLSCGRSWRSAICMEAEVSTSTATVRFRVWPDTHTRTGWVSISTSSPSSPSRRPVSSSPIRRETTRRSRAYSQMRASASKAPPAASGHSGQCVASRKIRPSTCSASQMPAKPSAIRSTSSPRLLKLRSRPASPAARAGRPTR
ncbi:MAG: hypothetical protein AMJ81_07020 [Phycisphaerae bacterium SM23_33]|nr:MAG: hypothetical protein AMJ81_07020 [Phycisphaerae bacterium SM23_33]